MRWTSLFALVVGASIAMPGFAAAEDAKAAACVVSVENNETNGISHIRLRSDCRKGQKVTAAYGDYEYATQFDSSGLAAFDIVLTEPKGEVRLSYADRQTETVPANFASLAGVMRISIIWETPVDLNLHVVEPRGVLGGAGDAATPVPGDNVKQLGRVDLKDDGLGFGPFQESYLIANRLQVPEVSFVVAVENVTRGRSPAGPHCQGGEYAKVPFTLIVVDRGTIKRRNYELAAQPCGVSLDDRVYYQRLHF